MHRRPSQSPHRRRSVQHPLAPNTIRRSRATRPLQVAATAARHSPTRRSVARARSDGAPRDESRGLAATFHRLLTGYDSSCCIHAARSRVRARCHRLRQVVDSHNALRASEFKASVIVCRSSGLSDSIARPRSCSSSSLNNASSGECVESDNPTSGKLSSRRRAERRSGPPPRRSSGPASADDARTATGPGRAAPPSSCALLSRHLFNVSIL